jgi:hypothetical protein
MGATPLPKPRNNISRLNRRVAGRSIDWRPKDASTRWNLPKDLPPWSSEEELEHYAIQLLAYLYRYPQRNITGFLEASRIKRHDALTLLDHLICRKFADDTTDKGVLSASLTTAGLSFAKDREVHLHPERRTGELRKRMLHWLSEYDVWEDNVRDWSSFLGSRQVNYCGTVFTEHEVDKEARYLKEHGLIKDGSGNDVLEGRAHLRLSAQGRDCIEQFGGNVTDYLNRTYGSTTSISMTDSVGNIVIGDNNVCHNTASGLDTSEILAFLNGVRESLSIINYSDEETRNYVENSAEELDKETQKPAPSAGRLRTLLSAIIERLREAAPSVIQEAVINYGEDAIKSIAGIT